MSVHKTAQRVNVIGTPGTINGRKPDTPSGYALRALQKASATARDRGMQASKGKLHALRRKAQKPGRVVSYGPEVYAALSN